MDRARAMIAVMCVVGCESKPGTMQDTSAYDAAGAPQGDASPTKVDAAVATDAGPGIVDVAQPIDVTPIPRGGKDDACAAAMGWWAINASFDSVITPQPFASAVNPLIASAHPITIADEVDESSTWTMRASGTLTNGGYQQYFPPSNTSDPTSMARTSASFSSGVANGAWIVVVDAASTTVWIPVQSASTSASYGDTYCQSLVSGELDATIPASAASIAITTSQGVTTLGALLGSSSAGWPIRLQFDGQKVDVSSK